MASQLMRSVDRVHVLRRILRTSSSSLSTSTSSTSSSSSSSEPSVCRIGCASGFWGDTAVASAQLLRRTRLDYLVFDYLSEITMTLLNAAKMKKPDMGYAPDFVATLAPNLKLIKEQGVRVVSNAGGVDPEACRAALLKTAAAEGFDLDVAVVTGDDLLARKGDFVDAKSMHTGKPVSMKGLTSMNAYFGAQPIARCLKAGAEIVITGRCVDSAVALGPLIHHFDWDMHDYDRLAAGR